MIRTSWTRVASIEETLALWAASLREVKKRIRPLFKQDRVAASAGQFLEEQQLRQAGKGYVLGVNSAHVF
jgi:hypothetical protein